MPRNALLPSVVSMKQSETDIIYKHCLCRAHVKDNGMSK